MPDAPRAHEMLTVEDNAIYETAVRALQSNPKIEHLGISTAKLSETDLVRIARARAQSNSDAMQGVSNILARWLPKLEHLDLSTLRTHTSFAEAAQPVAAMANMPNLRTFIVGQVVLGRSYSRAEVRTPHTQETIDKILRELVLALHTSFGRSIENLYLTFAEQPNLGPPHPWPSIAGSFTVARGWPKLREFGLSGLHTAAIEGNPTAEESAFLSDMNAPELRMVVGSKQSKQSLAHAVDWMGRAKEQRWSKGGVGDVPLEWSIHPYETRFWFRDLEVWRR
ncbi:hypothetical protein DFJ74DRAFT_399277 [Hyaloraphidium curvatum]|nr:hypothetical protein DFJ74DRAFT_399277 [Hyaloraphidium curvatum]